MNTKLFRAELVKIMPGYKWAVHRLPKGCISRQLVATGTQSSGSNRLSTLEVKRNELDGRVVYEARSSGFGLRAPWLGNGSGCTLAQALRDLQNGYEWHAHQYRIHADALNRARTRKPTSHGAGVSE